VVDYLLNISFNTTNQIRVVRAGMIPEVSRPRARKAKYQERRALQLMISNPAPSDDDLLQGYEFHCEKFQVSNRMERLGLNLADDW
jgi:hypothetical protein